MNPAEHGPLPTMSVVIVNFNTRDATIECIESAREHATSGMGIVVVDNGSHDGSADAIRSLGHPDITVVDAGGNLGFAAGVNIGVRHCGGEYVLLLNPDTHVLPGSLEALLRFAVENPGYGLYGGRTLRPDGRVDPSSCWGAPTLWSLVCFATGLSTAFKGSRVFDPESLGSWQRDTVREVPIITGCLLLVGREDWQSLGGMDEAFFLYGEDVEFSVRSRRAGHRPVIVPDATIVHEVGGSTGSSGTKMSMVMAGKVTFLRRAWPAMSARVGILLLQWGAALRAGLEAVTRRRDAMWTDVWRRRHDWNHGYPRAKQTLFGLSGSEPLPAVPHDVGDS